MRLIAMPLIAALLGCAMFTSATPASAEQTSKVATAKISHAKPTAKAAKSAKTSKTSKSSKKVVKTGKSSKIQKKPVKHQAAVRAADTTAELQSVAAVDQNDASSERIYDGLLPSDGEKIVMPVVKDENGRAECVQLIKSLMDAPRTPFWKEGRKLKASWDKIQPGTAIATFIKGRYPQQGKGRGNKHAAIFLRASAAGIYVFDQFAGRVEAEERFIPWHHPRDKRLSNNATAFSTVRW